MLTRDFSFRIYKEAVIRSELGSQIEDKESKGKDGKNETSKDEKSKEENVKADSKQDRSSESEKAEKEEKRTNSEGKKSDKKSDTSSDMLDVKKSSSVTRKPVDNELLLAFTFYDTGRCGYIKENDFEEICLLAGLSLTRAQV